jgi:hypothetical protein
MAMPEIDLDSIRNAPLVGRRVVTPPPPAGPKPAS